MLALLHHFNSPSPNPLSLSLKFPHKSPFPLHSSATFNNSASMKKVVLKVELYDERIKTKAMKAVSGLSGVESVSVDMKDKKMTLTGDIDPVNVVGKLRKKLGQCHTEIVSVGPAKEPEKKKEEPKKEPEKKKEEPKTEDLIKAYEAYYKQMRTQHYYPPVYVTSVEEDPNNCVIC